MDPSYASPQSMLLKPAVRGMTAWVGFEQTGVPYERDGRYAGDSKYPLRRMVRLAMTAITSFSFVPLQLASVFGFIVSGLAAIAVPIVVALRLLGRVRAELEFADASELCEGDLVEVLGVVESQIRDVASAVAAECFSYRVELDLHSLQLLPGDPVIPGVAPVVPVVQT